jgi:hypothetical protein
MSARVSVSPPDKLVEKKDDPHLALQFVRVVHVPVQGSPNHETLIEFSEVLPDFYDHRVTPLDP